MLDLEVVPERSLGNEQWEFTLGESGVLLQDLALPFTSLQAFPASGFCPLFPCARCFSPLRAPGTKLPIPTGQTRQSVACPGLDALASGFRRASSGAVVQ